MLLRLAGRPVVRAAPFFISALLLLFHTAARAHDFWIEPDTFRAAAGEPVALHLRVGESWKGEPVADVDPAGFTAVEAPGLRIAGYRSNKHEIRFDSFELFEKYLRQEGLERYLEPSRKRFDARGAILERYSRGAKTLIGAAGGASRGKDAADRALGLPIELIAETNPYLGARTMSVRLLYRGKPLEGVLAIASSRRNPAQKIRIRTGGDGRAAFELAEPGVWLITAVHLVPLPGIAGPDWESFWASLTFEVP